MKFLNCIVCHDIVKLHSLRRSCFCGAARGRYIDDRRVQVNENARVLGIDNFEYAEMHKQLPPRALAGGTFSGTKDKARTSGEWFVIDSQEKILRE